VRVTVAVPPEVRVAVPPVQVATAVFDEPQLTVTRPAKPLTEVRVIVLVLPVTALPAMVSELGEADIV
jgi:hypothetical protein